MSETRYIGDVKIGKIGVDYQGRFLLVTNAICILPHDTVETYHLSHSEGCLYRPYEGIVFEMEEGVVKTWRMGIISGDLSPVPEETEQNIKGQMMAALDIRREQEQREMRYRARQRRRGIFDK